MDHLYILYIVWIILFILGIRIILKYKLWKPIHYLRIAIIVFVYIIIIYQIRILYTCSPDFIEKYENANKTFKLYDRNKLMTQFQGGDAPTKFVWLGPLNWANGDHVTNYASDYKTDKKGSNRGKHCDATTVRELTELASVTLQQLEDARAAYNELLRIKTQLDTVNLNDNNALDKLVKEIKSASSLINKRT